MSTSTTDKPLVSPVSSTDASSKTAVHNSHPRLPCRGCMADCPNYATCDGKLWRKPV